VQLSPRDGLAEVAQQTPRAVTAADLGMTPLVTDSIMRDKTDRRRLAVEVLSWVQELQ
jgi:hypothetical protein